ncbi:carbonic anhydrase [Muricoccus radiodurans]|uniref:carbonic anhydrase n=1 Tax=Muricoccus radiodurans TaxID=2231721 RepID=UPI003CE99DB9
MCRPCEAAALGRRGLLTASVGVLAATGLGSQADAQPVPRAANGPAAAFVRLAAGIARYAGNATHERDFSAGRALRATGQAPYAAVLGCADPRVAPELLFDEEPGNLCVVHVAHNFVTTDGLASLEFGAGVLGVKQSSSWDIRAAAR